MTWTGAIVIHHLLRELCTVLKGHVSENRSSDNSGLSLSMVNDIVRTTSTKVKGHGVFQKTQKAGKNHPCEGCCWRWCGRSLTTDAKTQTTKYIFKRRNISKIKLCLNVKIKSNFPVAFHWFGINTFKEAKSLFVLMLSLPGNSVQRREC